MVQVIKGYLIFMIYYSLVDIWDKAVEEESFLQTDKIYYGIVTYNEIFKK